MSLSFSLGHVAPAAEVGVRGWVLSILGDEFGEQAGGCFSVNVSGFFFFSPAVLICCCSLARS